MKWPVGELRLPALFSNGGGMVGSLLIVTTGLLTIWGCPCFHMGLINLPGLTPPWLLNVAAALPQDVTVCRGLPGQQVSYCLGQVTGVMFR